MSQQDDVDVDSDFLLELDFDSEDGLGEAEDTELDLTPRIVDDQVHYSTRQKRERNRHRLPRVLKSDIKRHYSRMFMNTVNSADALEMQNFWSTFMIKSCKFVAQSDISPACNFPSEMITQGPRLTSHYLLGVFFMFPDMVVRMSDARIVTSAGWSGSRIEMDVEMTGTKVCSVPMHLWVPAVQTRDVGYSQDPTGTAAVSVMSNQLQAYPGNAASEASSTHTQGERSHPTHATKAKGNREHAGQERINPHDLSIQPTPSSSAAESAPHYTSPFIPRAHVKAMYEQATPLARPLMMVCNGKITFYLDASNHIQHLHMFLRQTNL